MLEYETLSGEEINNLLKGIPPSRDDFDNDSIDDNLETEGSVPNTTSGLKPGAQPNI